MTTTTMKRTLAARLLEVRRAVPVVHKDDTNQHQRYKFASSSAVINAVRTAMDDAGIVLIPSIVLAERSERTTKSGGAEILTELKMVYTIVNADDPTDKLEIGWYAQGIDTGERGVGKALTYGEKYLLLKLFQIPTDDADPDAEDRQAGSAAAKAQPTTQQAAQRQAMARQAQPTAKPSQSTVQADPMAMSAAQRGKMWHQIAGLMPSDASDDEKKSILDSVCVTVAGVRTSQLDKRGASAVIEYLLTATTEDILGTNLPAGFDGSEGQ